MNQLIIILITLVVPFSFSKHVTVNLGPDRLAYSQYNGTWAGFYNPNCRMEEYEHREESSIRIDVFNIKDQFHREEKWDDPTGNEWFNMNITLNDPYGMWNNMTGKVNLVERFVMEHGFCGTSVNHAEIGEVIYNDEHETRVRIEYNFGYSTSGIDRIYLNRMEIRWKELYRLYDGGDYSHFSRVFEYFTCW